MLDQYEVKLSPLFFNHFKDKKGFKGEIKKETITYSHVSIDDQEAKALIDYAITYANSKSAEAKERADLHRSARRILKTLARHGIV